MYRSFLNLYSKMNLSEHDIKKPILIYFFSIQLYHNNYDNPYTKEENINLIQNHILPTSIYIILGHMHHILQEKKNLKK